MANHQDGTFAVLSFSHDPHLLQTRALLLQRAGCVVLGTSTVPEFRTLLLSQPFDLILICQSISADECDSIAQFAKDHAPSARLLLMFTSVGKCMPEHADVLLDAHAGPRVFLETAQRMLASAASRSL